jgi:type I restriction enzyme M protein
MRNFRWFCVSPNYVTLGHSPSHASGLFNGVLGKAIDYYQNHLPRPVDRKLPSKATGEVLLEICKTLAPIKLIASKRDVVQVFYMKFAKGLYKWDLAQFFTPPTVTDFIVDVLNPQFGEHIKDPACGSADFLTAAFHKRRDVDPNFASCVWGADNSKNAVQVAVLNMLLNGDGKSNIKELDSLERAHEEANKYPIVVCNPPFGIRIVEKRKSVLKTFDLGHEWKWSDVSNSYVKLEKLLASQETGLLFTEVCVIQAKEKGRIAIILPNGYLGNRSKKYKIFREWLLRHTRLVAVCAFPRFTFKTSGADVSTSVLYLEKRETPIKHVKDDSNYSFTIQMIEKVGWNLGDKKAAPKYIRNEEDGSYIINGDGGRILDADFDGILGDIRRSVAAHQSPWLTKGIDLSAGQPGWSLNISTVLADDDLTIDAKRYTKKFVSVQTAIGAGKHFTLDAMVDFIPERRTSTGQPVKKSTKSTYNYVEIAEIGHGDYKSTAVKGWELPDRAKHFAEPRDIYMGSIWSSVSKWCIICKDAKNTVVTNGCHRVRMKPSMEKYLVDLAAFMCSEAYVVQMRGYARGSDGLAEVPELDVKRLLIPILKKSERDALTPFVDALVAGAPDLHSNLNRMVATKNSSVPYVPKRTSHVILV